MLEPIGYSDNNGQSDHSDHMDNIILMSTMDEIQPMRTDKLAQKSGYLSERGPGGRFEDDVSQLYQDSKLANGTDKMKGFNPKESTGDRFSSVKNAYQEDQEG